MEKYCIYFLLLFDVLVSCERKSDTVCTDVHDSDKPKITAYLKPEGTKIKYKSTKGDTATLIFGPIIPKQGSYEEKKPCRRHLFTDYSQEILASGAYQGVFPYKQETIKTTSIRFLFSSPNTGIDFDYHDDESYRSKANFVLEGKEYKDLLIWTNKIAAYNILPHDTILYNSTSFIVKLKQADGTTWTILN